MDPRPLITPNDPNSDHTMDSETSDITTLELRTSDIPIADLQTSNISTAEIWQAVANQWARGEGRAVLLKPEEDNRATSARDHPHTSDSDDDPPLGKQLAKLSIDEPSPEEKIYFEKVLSRNGVMCLAYAKSLPSPSEPCAHMVTADKQLCGQTAYFSRADEDLSLLVGYDCGWIFRLFEGVMGISDSFSTRLGAETQDGSSEAATHRPPSVRQQHTGIRTVVRPLALSHPAIRKSMTSVELGIHVPIKRDFTRFDKTSRTEVVDEVLFSKVTSQLKRRLLSLSNDLASFENLKFLRIVLVGWGRGDLQSFKEGGIVAEYVLPFFDLLDVGICLGIQVQMWGSVAVFMDGSRFGVRDFRREMNETEAWDFEEQFNARRVKVGKGAMELVKTVGDKTSIIRCPISRGGQVGA